MTAKSLWEWLGSPGRNPPSPSSPEVSREASSRLEWAAVGNAVGASSDAAITHLPKLLDHRGEEITSLTMSPFVLQQLAAAVPARFKFADWRLLYSTGEHGISLNTLYGRTARCGSCYLVIKDASGNIFGAFCSEWREPNQPNAFYGSGETFLFSVERVEGLPPLPAGEHPPPHEAVQIYRWTGANSLFMFSDREHLAIGSGGHFGVWLDSELLHGSSGPCATFGNQCLCYPAHAVVGGMDLPAVGEFRCSVLEIWGMEHSLIAKREKEKYLNGG